MGAGRYGGGRGGGVALRQRRGGACRRAGSLAAPAVRSGRVGRSKQSATCGVVFSSPSSHFSSHFSSPLLSFALLSCSKPRPRTAWRPSRTSPTAAARRWFWTARGPAATARPRRRRRRTSASRRPGSTWSSPAGCCTACRLGRRGRCEIVPPISCLSGWTTERGGRIVGIVLCWHRNLAVFFPSGGRRGGGRGGSTKQSGDVHGQYLDRRAPGRPLSAPGRAGCEDAAVRGVNGAPAAL